MRRRTALNLMPTVFKAAVSCAIIACNYCLMNIFHPTFESLQLLHAGIAARCMQ